MQGANQQQRQRSNLVVDIRADLRTIIPFGKLQSRVGAITMLGYFDDSDGVLQILQVLNHSTRAYAYNIVSVGSLTTFLQPSWRKILRQASASELEEVTRYQHVDIKAVLPFLEEMKTYQEKFDFLGEEYPCLLVFLLKSGG